MLTSVPGLAKLTRPRLFGAIARSRLFDYLDHERERRAMLQAGNRLRRAPA